MTCPRRWIHGGMVVFILPKRRVQGGRQLNITTSLARLNPHTHKFRLHALCLRSLTLVRPAAVFALRMTWFQFRPVFIVFGKMGRNLAELCVIVVFVVNGACKLFWWHPDTRGVFVYGWLSRIPGSGHGAVVRNMASVFQRVNSIQFTHPALSQGIGVVRHQGRNEGKLTTVDTHREKRPAKIAIQIGRRKEH